jgi:hypothetical protein
LAALSFLSDRPLTWGVVEEALREVNIEVKLAALRGGDGRGRPTSRFLRSTRQGAVACTEGLLRLASRSDWRAKRGGRW